MALCWKCWKTFKASRPRDTICAICQTQKSILDFTNEDQVLDERV